ncbi:hypothetical protein HY383_01900 [Candidatus Daviesbacteria bacterium]|nr:hypothetical protein [Candidatus Daviesbacteria bacterium]
MARIEINMSEGGLSSEIGSQGVHAHNTPVETGPHQSSVLRQRFLPLEGYDPRRAKEYTSNPLKGGQTSFIDPLTGKEVARIMPDIGGGSDEDDLPVQGAVGGEGDRLRGPESPNGPERGPEWETSPERGRAIVREILRLETTLPYTERYRTVSGLLSTVGKPEIYNERNGPYLDQLYADLQDYTRALRRVRNIRDEQDPWDPRRIYNKIKEALERRARGESSETNQLGINQRDRGERPVVLPAESLNVLFEKYADDANTETVEVDMATWFKEARNFGLLDRADALFTSFYKQITQGNIPPQQVEEELTRVRDFARGSIEALLRSRRTDPRAAPLRGIAEAYSQRTCDILERMLTGERPDPIEGEFSVSENIDDEGDTQTHWRPGHWPKTYEILAKTPKQFRRAVDSFLSAVTGGRLGKSPNELYEHFNNFTQMVGQAATSENMDEGFSTALRQELQGHGFVFGGDYSFETYNMSSAHQFLMAMAMDEGPDRWIRVARSGNGAVGAYLWKFDYDPRIKLMHNPGGSRGQLLNDTVTQHYLHTEIKGILIEEGMGVVMKNYDPRDVESAAYGSNSIRVLKLEEAEQAREKAIAANLVRIGIHQPKEEFKSLYNGFDSGNAHLINYQTYRDWNDDELRTISPALRKSVIIGKVQSLLLPHDGKEKHQLIDVIDELIAQKRLTDRDKKFWEEAYDHSKANFATAFQMVGSTGEKARRGGGVFFIDRKDGNGRRFVDNIPVYEAEMFIQYVETRIKIQFANSSAEVRTKAVDQARAVAIQQLKTNGYEAKLKFGKLKFDMDKNSPNFGDVIGLDGDLEEIIDFETATDPENPLNKWLNHSYLSYQPENRHQVINPDIVQAAKRRRMRLLRPDLMIEPESEEDQHEKLADIRLILDPTLNRVPSLKDTDMPEGTGAQQAEILLSDAAVEASNYSHWRIVRELNAAFMPKDGNIFKFRTGYNLEDYSGIARFIIRMRQFVASNPKRFARRYAAELANLPLNVSSMPDQWGQVGVLGAIEMFADPVGEMSEQRLAGQFAITKWVEQMKIGNMIYGALVGHVDSEKGFSIEGLFEKPTNNSERVGKIQEILDRLEKNETGVFKDYNAEIEFMNLVLESFDRLWTVLKLVRTMESDTRNAQGALNLENKEVLKDDKPNVEILNALAKDRNTGSARHTEEQFFNAYIDWLISETEGGGGEAYPGELQWYKRLKEKTILDPKREMTRAKWLFNKMSR